MEGLDTLMGRLAFEQTCSQGAAKRPPSFCSQMVAMNAQMLAGPMANSATYWRTRDTRLVSDAVFILLAALPAD